MRQRMQPTGTNRSFGLITPPWSTINQTGNRKQRTADREEMILILSYLYAVPCMLPPVSCPLYHPLCRPGGHGEETSPDPIPNSAVKLLSANGTSSQDAEE